MGCVKSKCKDECGVIQQPKNIPIKIKPRKDSSAPFEPDEELLKAYLSNISAIRSEGVKYGVLKVSTSDSPLLELDDSETTHEESTPPGSAFQSKKGSVFTNPREQPEESKSTILLRDPLLVGSQHPKGAIAVFYCFPHSAFWPIGEGRSGRTRLAAMAFLSADARNATPRKPGIVHLWREDPVSAAFLDIQRLVRYVRRLETAHLDPRGGLSKLGSADLNWADALSRCRFLSNLEPGVTIVTPSSSVPSSNRSSKRGPGGANAQLPPVRRFLVVAKELRFSTEHPREELLAYLQEHMRRWVILSAQSPYLLRYLHMEHMDANEGESSFPPPNGDSFPHSALRVSSVGANCYSRKDSAHLLSSSKHTLQEREGSKRQESLSADLAYSTSHEIVGVRIYTELAKHGTLHSFQKHEMHVKFGRTYLHELTARAYMREVLLGLVFLHENGELQYDLSARSIFLHQPICSVYKTYFPAYISEVPVGNLTQVSPLKFGHVLKLLNPKPLRSEEPLAGLSSSSDAFLDRSLSQEGREYGSVCHLPPGEPTHELSLHSQDHLTACLEGFAMFASKTSSAAASVNSAQPNARKSVGFDLSRAARPASEAKTQGAKEAGEGRQGKSNALLPAAATLLRKRKAPLGSPLRFPFPKDPAQLCWDSLAFQLIGSAIDYEEYEPPPVSLPAPQCHSYVQTVQTKQRVASLPLGEGALMRYPSEGQRLCDISVVYPAPVSERGGGSLGASVTPRRFKHSPISGREIGNRGGSGNDIGIGSSGLLRLHAASSPGPPPLLLTTCGDPFAPQKRFSSSVSHPSLVTRLSLSYSKQISTSSSRGCPKSGGGGEGISEGPSWGCPRRHCSLIRLPQTAALRRGMALRNGAGRTPEAVPPQRFVSVAHAAPEVLVSSRRTFSPATDIYAFAMTFIELVTPGGRIMPECLPKTRRKNRTSGPEHDPSDALAANLRDWYRQRLPGVGGSGPNPECLGSAVTPVSLPAHLSDECKAMLRSCLHPDPKKRPMALELLEQKYFLFGDWISQKNANGHSKRTPSVKLPEKPWDSDVDFEKVAEEAGFPVLPADLCTPLPGLAASALDRRQS